jgi:hypothetical protein
MSRRTLTRSLAMAVALAALSTLIFAADCHSGSAGGLQHQPRQTAGALSPQ